MSGEPTLRDAGLGERESSVIMAAHYARNSSPDGHGHFLASGKQSYHAAMRLIDRGFLTKGENQVGGMPESIVVYLSDDNWKAVGKAARANKGKAR